MKKKIANSKKQKEFIYIYIYIEYQYFHIIDRKLNKQASSDNAFCLIFEGEFP